MNNVAEQLTLRVLPPGLDTITLRAPAMRSLFLDLLNGRCVTQVSKHGNPVAHKTARADRMTRMMARAKIEGYTIVQVPGPSGGTRSGRCHYFLMDRDRLPDCSYCQASIPKMVMARLKGGTRS